MNNVFNISKSDDQSLENIYNQSMDELNQFFQMNWVVNKPKICVIDNRSTIDAFRDQETPKWLVGWNIDRIVYVLSKVTFVADGEHEYSEDAYKMLIKHELAHAFFKAITGGKSQPNWLWEGVSILTAGQASVWKKPKGFKNFLDNKDVYVEAGYALLLLTRKFGNDSLIKLLKSYKTYQGEFSNLFKEIYNLELSYDTFNRLHDDIADTR